MEMYKVGLRSVKTLSLPATPMESQASFMPGGRCLQPQLKPRSSCELPWPHRPFSICANARESSLRNFLILVFHRGLAINLQRKWEIKTAPDQTWADSRWDGGKRMSVWAQLNRSCLPLLTTHRGTVKALSSHQISSARNCWRRCLQLLPHPCVTSQLPRVCLTTPRLTISSRCCFCATDNPKPLLRTCTCVCRRRYRNGPKNLQLPLRESWAR